MNRSTIYNALLGVTAVAALLVGYNALLSKKGANSPTSKIASYLSITPAKQEAKDAENNVAGTDNANAAASSDAMSESTPEAMSEGDTVTKTKDESTAATVVVTPPVASTPTTTASTYTVKDGDTYGCIAEKYYGSFENWVEVDSANPNTEGFLERRLFVGTVLTLPALTAEQVRPTSTLCQ